MAIAEQFDLRSEYELLQKQGRQSLRQDGVHADDLLPEENDKRRGLGLFFWQNVLVSATQPFLEKIHQKFAEEIVLYGFPGSPARQHVTLLELVATQINYEPNFQELERKFEAVCRPILEKAHPITARFGGLAVNSGVILLKGYPVDNSFNDLRVQLREAIDKAGLPPLKRRNVQIFHTTVGRFLKPIKDVGKLIELIGEFNEYEVGDDVYKDLHLVRASWLMSESQTCNLADYHLV